MDERFCYSLCVVTALALALKKAQKTMVDVALSALFVSFTDAFYGVEIWLVNVVGTPDQFRCSAPNDLFLTSSGSCGGAITGDHSAIFWAVIAVLG